MGGLVPESDDEYLTTAEVARLLRASPSTVSRWADQGLLPHLVTLGGHRRFRRSGIERLGPSAGDREPRRPRPSLGSGAMALVEPNTGSS